MKVKIDEIIKQRGKSRNWLSEETGIEYKNICKICKNETTSIQFDTIDKICSVLNCDVSDIIEHEPLVINRLIAYQNKIKRLSDKDDTQ